MELIINIVKSQDFPRELKNKFLFELTRAKKLADVRNLLAHNPVQMSVYQHQPTGDILIQPEIASMKKNKVVDIKQLRKHTDEVEKISADLYIIMGELFAKSSKDV